MTTVEDLFKVCTSPDCHSEKVGAIERETKNVSKPDDDFVYCFIIIVVSFFLNINVLIFNC